MDLTIPASFEEFRARALAEGFDEAVVREWQANVVADTHTHPFDASAVITEGEMWLTYDGKTEHLPVGGTFELSAGTPHAERYGPQGATYWVARRNRG